MDLSKTSENFRFATAVAQFGLVLGEEKYKGKISKSQILSLAKGAKGKDKKGYREEFIKLVEKYYSM